MVKRKKFIVLTVIFLFAALILIAIGLFRSEFRFDYKDYTYCFSHNTVAVIDYHGNDDTITLPGRIFFWEIKQVGYPYWDYDIDDHSFMNATTVRHVIVPEGIEEILYSFDDCEIETIELPDSLTFVQDSFSRCANLEAIIGGNHISYADDSFSGMSKWKENVDGDFVIIGDGVLVEYRGDSERVMIPDGVKRISSSVFYNNRVKTVVLPESLVSIGGYAFCLSKVNEVIGGENVSDIGNKAFDGTEWMRGRKEDFVIFGDGVLISCNKNDAVIEVPETVKHVAMYAFEGQSGFSAIILPETVETIAGQYGSKKRAIVIQGMDTTLSPSFAHYSTGNVLYVQKGSLAEVYAKQNKMEYHDISEFQYEKQ